MSRVFIYALLACCIAIPSVSLPLYAVEEAPPTGVPESPTDFPDGWDDCMKERVKIAYVRSLPWYQRIPLEPYRLVKKWQYVRCVKALIPETEARMEGAYPVPFDPYKDIPAPKATTDAETPD